jgi:DNA (cytosine-5)-methyltransferase 1
MGHAASHPNGGGQVAVAITTRPYADGDAQDSRLVVAVAGEVTHALRAEGADASEDGTGRGTPLVAITETPECASLAIRGREGGLSAETLAGDAAHALRAAQGTLDKPHVLLPNVVRRLTPIEAERLQGFADGHTLIPYGRNRRIKDLEEMAGYWGVTPEVAKTLAADSLRYKAVGNSMAVPVIWWIGRRIEWVLERLGISRHFQNGESP